MRQLRIGVMLIMALLVGCAGAPYKTLVPSGALRAKNDLRTCVQHTGTHIVVDGDLRCVGHGHTYSQETIRGTGAEDIGRSLQNLDLSVSTSSTRGRAR